jgi:hypothetical protein
MIVDNPAAYLSSHKRIDAWLTPQESRGHAIIRFATIEQVGSRGWIAGIVTGFAGSPEDDVYALEDVDPDRVLAEEQTFPTAESAVEFVCSLAEGAIVFLTTEGLQRAYEEFVRTGRQPFDW